jgi:PAS domain S-box-containing protein
LRWEVRPWYDTAGTIGGIVIFTEDLSERKQAEALLEESEKRFRAVHERAPVGIALMDAQSGRFLQVNPKYCEIAGRDEKEMLRLGFRDITHPDDVTDSVDRLNHLISEDSRFFEVTKRYVRPDGTIVWVNLSVVPMWSAGEAARWHMAIVQDVTERKQAEEALRESEERLRLAQEVAQIGTFDQNLITGKSRLTPNLRAIYGLQPDQLVQSVQEFINLIHPDDRAQVSALVARSMKSGEGHGEWRTRWADGTIRWIASRWRVFKDAGGRPERALGVDFDITDRKRVEEELRQAKERLTEEKLYLEHEIDTELGFEEIVGQSKVLKAVMENVTKVAGSDATVLLLGETGTGKELVARAIHRLSRRAGNAFIKTNCAAIPSGLLESELFGNEKGAFTGAISRRIGRLELADKGTLFLDEIGEISLALQPKLLRVLQDQEFERLGGTQTLKTDFRVIAATNRDLGASVRQHEFRSDLYYRLNVFPILLPALRERREDIPILVEHFVQKIGRRMNKSIKSIPKKTMDAFVEWNWPGNIRELENFIERSMILTTGSVLAAPLRELQIVGDLKSDDTLKSKEREHILRALRASRGQVSGLHGAAARLGLKRTTLQSKLKSLGIDPRVPPVEH